MEQSTIAIDVQNITKQFRVYPDKGNQLKERLLFRKRRRFETHQVLDGVSFQVRRGEAVGLIGRNGCGKSTTLKLLTRIMYPDSGKITMNGRVSSLIELGAGFHPDMSGRENIYTNASIFGLTRREIDRRLPDIIAFSELEEWIDNPVRTYSSGMYMRLAFSVAIHVDADILLIDEILAVGDAAFQAKCFDKLRDIKARGTTIVIVSHSLGQIEQICDRSLWLHEGKLRADGPPAEIDLAYLESMGQAETPPLPPLRETPKEVGNSMEINIEEIMQSIRQEIADKHLTPDMLSFADVPFQEEPSPEEAMRCLSSQCSVQPFRPLAGNPLSVFVKRVIRRLIRFCIAPIVEEQNRFNANAVRVLNEMQQTILRQEAELDALRSRPETQAQR